MDAARETDPVTRAVEDLRLAGSRIPGDAIDRLSEAGPSAVPALLDLLDSVEPDEDDWTPLWTAVALGETRDPRAVPALLRLLGLHEGDTLAEAAVEAIAKIGAPAMPALAAFAREAREWEARHYAYGAIGLIPGDESLRFLVEALGRDPLLWSSIAIALADLGDRRAVAPLVATLTKCDQREAPAVREAIEILEGRQPPYPRLDAKPWRERYGWGARGGERSA